MKKLILSILIIGSISVRAEEVFQASLTPDIAIHSKITQINGLALSIWGENPQQALALGLINGSTGDSSGISWSLVNYADSYTGIAWGVVNYSRTSFVGWQDATVNFSQGHFLGLQMGAVNFAEEMNGLQIGVVNYAEHLHGVQLGFINFAMNNPCFKEMPDKLAPAFPFFNWSF
jgi:hypothetical protein